MSTTVTIRYRNWRGEERTRRIVPIRIWHGSTRWHPEPQWLLEARCLDDDVDEQGLRPRKDFALAGILEWSALAPWQQTLTAEAERDALRAAIAAHHAQKADDRCWEDDDRLYAAAGLPLPDRRVGDKVAMLANCARFIDKRCEGGYWPSYMELEAERDALRARVQTLETVIAGIAHQS